MYTTANTWANPNPTVFGRNNFGVIGGTTITAFPGNPFPPIPPHTHLLHSPYHAPHNPHIGPIHSGGSRPAHFPANHSTAYTGMRANEEALRRARESQETNRRNQENLRRQQENARLMRETAERTRDNLERARANDERMRRNQENLQRQLENNRHAAQNARRAPEQGRQTASWFRPTEARRPTPVPHPRPPTALVLDGPVGLLATPPRTVKSAPDLIMVPPELVQRGRELGLETEWPIRWNNARLQLERGTLITLDRIGRIRLPGPVVRGTLGGVIWNSDNSSIMKRGLFSMVPDENYETIGTLHTHPKGDLGVPVTFGATDIANLSRDPSKRLAVLAESGSGQMWMLLRTAQTRYADIWGQNQDAWNTTFANEINRSIVTSHLPVEAAVLATALKMATDCSIAFYRYTPNGFIKVTSEPK